jgi:hypothetical protein
MYASTICPTIIGRIGANTAKNSVQITAKKNNPL